MASIDSLLRIIATRGAESLTLESGKAPVLRRRGENEPLSMPPIGDAMMETFAGEVVPEERREAFEAEGRLELRYRAEDGASFAVQVRRTASGLRLAFHPRAEASEAAGGERAREGRGIVPSTPTPALPLRGREIARDRDEGREREHAQLGEAGGETGREGRGIVPSTPTPALPLRGREFRESGRDLGGGKEIRGSGRDLGEGREIRGSGRDLGEGREIRGSGRDLGEGRESGLELAGGRERGGEGGDPLVLRDLLERAALQDASDILVTTGGPARLRVGGQLVAVEDVLATEADILALLGDALGDAGEAELARLGHTDLALDLRASGGLRYRVNLFRQYHGLAAALRPIRVSPPDLGALQLPEQLARVTGYPHGLVLVTGPAGSGKSTTLVALTEHLNRTRRRHIITLEDPIEYEYTSQEALIHQREVGAQVASFGAGLRAALRESPDVIVVGEMRDLDTIAAAISAAETGHLVMSTLHTNRAADAIDRMIDVFPAHQQRQVRVQLASVLRAVVTQFLLPTTAPPERVPAVEILHVNSAIAAMIRDDKCHQIHSQLQTGRDAGMVPIERSLATLIRAGRITAEAARQVLPNPEDLRPLIGGR